MCAGAKQQQMEPLATHQEMLLSSDDHNKKVTEHVNASNKMEHESGDMEGQIDISRDCSDPKFDQIPSDKGIVDDSEIGTQVVYDYKQSFNGTDATKNKSIQEQLQNEPAFDDDLIVSNAVDSSNDSGLKDFDSNLPVDTAASTTELGENAFSVEPGNVSNYDANAMHIDTEQLDKMTSSSGGGSSSIPNTSSSVADLPDINVDVAVNPQSNISDPEFFPQKDLENLLPASAKENLDLNKIPEVSADGNKSSMEEQLISKNDQDTNNNIEMNRSKSESPNSGVFFSSPGIPAPSIVSAAVQMLPGKVLVPAAVDQVQGQALAALQVLKVFLCSYCFFEGMVAQE